MTTVLPKLVNKGKKRLGRGYGSGKGGHTSSRGQKGQKARSKINILFEGVKMKKSLLRRLPQLKGKDKFKPKKETIGINLAAFGNFRAGSKINKETLVESGMLKASHAKKSKIKILGEGKINKKLTFEIPTTASAKKKIEKAGGSVVSSK